MNNDDVMKHTKDPRYIPGIYNYCDRWCERCPFTSRCLNCTLVEERFGDLRENDVFNEAFWEKFAEILRETLHLVKEMAEKEGIDVDAIAAEVQSGNKDSAQDALGDLIAHLSKNYASSVDEWFDSSAVLLGEKELERNRIRPVSDRENPEREAADIADAIEVIRWYQYQIHVKLGRAVKSLMDEEAEEFDDFPKDSDGSAKVALIGIDRSIAAWQMLLGYFPGEKKRIRKRAAMLENLRKRVEVRFPQARDFVRPGFDEVDPG